MKQIIFYILFIHMFFHVYLISAPVPVPSGGTGISTNPTANSIVLANSTSSTAFQFLTGSGSTAGQVLTSTGGASTPTWTTNGWPGKVSGTFMQAGTSSVTSNAPSQTTLINPNTYGAITNSAIDNVAVGYNALALVTSGNQNVAVGSGSLDSITTGDDNTAIGRAILNAITTTSNCTMVGNGSGIHGSLSNTTCFGFQNIGNVTTANSSDSVAIGYQALYTTRGFDKQVSIGTVCMTNGANSEGNVVIGRDASANPAGVNTPSQCVALGNSSLNSSTAGSNHVCLGRLVGNTFTALTSNNLIVGNAAVPPNNAASNQIALGLSTMTVAYFYGIFGVTVAGGISVLINGSGLLGTVPSSKAFKHNIAPLDQKIIYNKMLNLWPTSFNYINDTTKTKHYGLIAEQVINIFPELVIYNTNGSLQGVQYHKLTALLIDALQYQRNKIQKLQQRLHTLSHQYLTQNMI